jgi:cation:H+ antiporter
MTLQWITFGLSSVAIILAGVRLAPYGDAIGRRTGIGQGWIGLLFLATLTSIPEMTTTVTGALIDAPNIALGNAFGSNLFNVVIITLLDMLLLGRGPFLLKVRSYHVLSGSVAILLTSLAALGMVVQSPMTWLGISPFSWLILIGYVVGVLVLYHAEKRQLEAEEETDEPMSFQKALLGFFICAAVVIAAGIFLIRASKAISLSSGLSESFMGAVLVAIVTSLPELATSIGALRIGAYDMIVGNLFGSNMFNILTIFFADSAFRSGSILSDLGGGETDQLIVAICGILLTVIAMISIGVRSRRKLFGVGVDSLILGGAYLMATVLIISRGIHL